MEKNSENGSPVNQDLPEFGFHNQFGFPYKTTLSFVPLIEKLEETASDPSVPEASLIQEVLKTVKAIPQLLQPIEDLSLLKKYRKEVNLLLSLVVPSTMIETSVVGIIIPFQPVTIYGSKRFKELCHVNEEGVWNLQNINPAKNISELIALCGIAILSKYYGYFIERPGILKSRELDKATGMISFFQPEVNGSFARVVTKKTPKKLSEIDLRPLKDDFFDTEFWLRNFPPDTFEIEGFAIYRMFDITDRELITQLEYTLLQSGSIIMPEIVQDIEEKMRIYFRLPQMKIGVAPMLNYRGQLSKSGMDKWNCFIPRDKQQMMFRNFEKSIYSKAFEGGKPYLVEDIAALPDRSPVEDELLNQGIRTIIIVPVFQKRELIGAFEIGEAEPNSFNFISLLKLNEIIPLISISFQRAAKDFDMQVQATIKENFTSIHPAVEWKFAQAALDKISQSTDDEEAEIGPIEFNDVMPIYGQIDIRGSSDTRNEAIRLDMIDYLIAAKKILDEAQKDLPLVILDELSFRIDKYLGKLYQAMDSGDETGILEFMRTEVEPALKIISEQNPVLKTSVDNFHASLDSDHEHYHMRRKNFEDSLTMINEVVARVLDEEEDYTQELLPHYFEKYKTDGVEYNLYIGQSILQHGTFDPILLRSFRLWQLITMVKIARETHRLIPYMSTPLDTTQLILCYSNPFSIMFRMDEKRFDVAGAYNIRYEIVKKRIDKSHVKDTEERVTQPHKIAVIYTQDKEAKEYERYFEYLQSKKLISEEIEYLEVEDLQGLHGLRAMRIAINYDPMIDAPLNYDEEELWKQVKDVMV
ncbi:MAG: GAF domain-containing protein [Chitinophagales bacterium]|nr:GAF domain-containing protein [Chitinophagales bacterium]